jgi:UMF1 family MFS transporter
LPDTSLRRQQRAWYCYDFANSAFASTVVTLFLGPWLTVLAKAGADAGGFIYPLGIPVDARSYWGYLISLSVLSQVFLLPVAGALADRSQQKKQLLGLFAYIGAGSTIAMFWLDGARYMLGGALFLIANLAFGASIVIYNAFLPGLSSEADRDTVSSRGWGIGYLGGGILLGLNLILYSKAAAWGLDEGLAVRISLASAGVWWALFSAIPMLGLRNPATPPLPHGGGAISGSFVQLWTTLRSLKAYPQALLFLVAFLLYNDAIQAVITLSGQFGSDYLKIPMAQLTLAILMVQFVAVAGAFGMNELAKRWTAKRTVEVALVAWILLMLGVFLVKTTAHFFIAAALVAVIMGGSQALSRSLFSLMIPKGREAEYFSLYEISDKGTSWLAPLLFSLTLQFTGSYQLGILSQIVFFAAGLILLSRVDVRKAALAAGNEAP